MEGIGFCNVDKLEVRFARNNRHCLWLEPSGPVLTFVLSGKCPFMRPSKGQCASQNATN